MESRQMSGSRAISPLHTSGISLCTTTEQGNIAGSWRSILPPCFAYFIIYALSRGTARLWTFHRFLSWALSPSSVQAPTVISQHSVLPPASSPLLTGKRTLETTVDTSRYSLNCVLPIPLSVYSLLWPRHSYSLHCRNEPFPYSLDSRKRKVLRVKVFYRSCMSTALLLRLFRTSPGKGTLIPT